MKRIDDDTIALTQAELDDIQAFIYRALDREWDDHTNRFICSDAWHDGMRRMNPEMYNLYEKMVVI